MEFNIFLSFLLCIGGVTAQIKRIQDCDEGLGCLVFPSGCTDNCDTVITYTYNPGERIVEFTMQSTKDWSSVAFNPDQQMSGLKGVMCINVDGEVTLSSRRASSRSTPVASSPDIVLGNNPFYMGNSDGINTCAFSRTLDVPSGSEQFMYDLRRTDLYILWATGPVRNGRPGFHDRRDVSEGVIDIQEFEITTTATTTTTTTTTPTSTTPTTTSTTPTQTTTTPTSTTPTTTSTTPTQTTRTKTTTPTTTSTTPTATSTTTTQTTTTKTTTTSPTPTITVETMPNVEDFPPEVRENCANDPFGFFPHPQYPDKFVRCDRKRIFQFSCPAGLIWRVLKYGNGYCGFPIYT